MLPRLTTNLSELGIREATPGVLKTCAGLGAGYFLYKLFRIWLIRREYRHIPGPPCNGIFGFFFGNALDFIKAKKEGRIMADLIVEWREKYGNTFKMFMLGRVLLFTADKQAIKEILINKNYPKAATVIQVLASPFGERFIGRGLVTDLDNKRWRHRRAMFNAGFHRNVLMTFADQFNQKADILMEKLRAKADGQKVIQLFPEINRATLDAIALIAFGMNLDSVNQPNSIFNVYIASLLNAITQLLFNPLAKFNLKLRLETIPRIRYLRRVGREKILERIAAMENQEAVPNDILSNILRTSKDENLDLDDMVDDFITFFIAGQETTANALSFAFIELGRNPSVLAKAREEVDRVIGQRAEITHQDISELKYCASVFKESMRLWPPAPQISRIIPERIEIDGYQIPKDTWVMFSTYANARDESNFKDCLEFKPERFLKDETTIGTNIENYCYFPFSLGPRNCIGQNFAIFEGIVMIAKLLQRFDFRLDPTQSFHLINEITLRPKDGTRVFLTLRQT